MGTTREYTGSMNQFSQTGSGASWRSEEVYVPAKSLQTVTFLDTNPNMFFLQNSNACAINIGITKIPSADKYEFRVNPNSTKTFGRPTSTNRLYLYNMGDVGVTVSLFSVYGAFDLSILQNTEVSMGDVALNGEMIVAGFGSACALPTGDNVIGRVKIEGGSTAMPEETAEAIEQTYEAMEKLIATNGVSGATNLYTLVQAMKELRGSGLYTLQNLYTEMNAVETAVSRVETAIGNLSLTVEAGGSAKFTDFVSYEGTVTENAVVVFETGEFIPNYIHFITNDGETDFTLQLYLTASKFREVTLKAGESLTDIPCTLYGFGVKVNGSASYRGMFGLKG